MIKQFQILPIYCLFSTAVLFFIIEFSKVFKRFRYLVSQSSAFKYIFVSFNGVVVVCHSLITLYFGYLECWGMFYQIMCSFKFLLSNLFAVNSQSVFMTNTSDMLWWFGSCWCWFDRVPTYIFFSVFYVFYLLKPNINSHFFKNLMSRTYYTCFAGQYYFHSSLIFWLIESIKMDFYILIKHWSPSPSSIL